jgi:DNA invertase Pin-like site-specific DNA recombinase
VRPRATDPKIKACHTSRLAIAYIRRSSLYMVREHTASGMHQRSFKDLARAYGWEEHLIIEVDEDDGRSATDTTKRKGFQWIRRQIFEDKVGAIFCWEASRLSRDIADFTQFIKLCGTYDTLIIDEKAVYDPNDENDNASLGIQGVMNQNESRRTGRRSKATKRTKAKAGELRLRPPTGYVYDDGDNLVFDKTENAQGSMNVQETILLLFL